MSDKAIFTVTVTGYNTDGEGVARLDDGRVIVYSLKHNLALQV